MQLKRASKTVKFAWLQNIVMYGKDTLSNITNVKILFPAVVIDFVFFAKINIQHKWKNVY